jgi:hypothetical protein
VIVHWADNIALFFMFSSATASDASPLFRTSPDGITWTTQNTDMPDGMIADETAYHDATGATVAVGTIWASPFTAQGTYANPFGRTYSSEDELLDNDLAPPPGGVGVYLAGGYFKLGSLPAGTVTADVVQGAAASDRTAGQLFADVAVRAGLSAGEWSAADVTALDNINSAELGHWSGLSETLCSNVADQLLHSIGGWWGADETGVLRVGILQDPTALTQGHNFVTRDVDLAGNVTSLRRVRPTDANQGIPYYEIVVGHAKSWTVQESGVVGAVTQARRERLALEYLEATFSDTGVQTEHPLADISRRDTLMSTTSDAEAEAERLHRMLRYPAEMFILTTAYDATDQVRVGDIARVTNDLYGLDSPGRRFACVKIETKPTALPPSQTLTLWRPASFVRATPRGTSTVTVSGNIVHGMTAAAAGVGSVAEITGVAEDQLSSETTANGSSTTSAILQIRTFWGWDGITPAPNNKVYVASGAQYSSRAGSGQFSPGAGTYLVTHLTYNWDADTDANGDVRLGLYTDEFAPIDNGDLEYDHGKVTPPSGGGYVEYPVSGRVEITHGNYVFVVAKSNEPIVKFEVHTAGAGDIDRHDKETTFTEDPDPDTAWTGIAPTSWALVGAQAIAVGIFYVST